MSGLTQDKEGIAFIAALIAVIAIEWLIMERDMEDSSALL